MSKEAETLISTFEVIQKIDSAFPIQYAKCLAIVFLHEGITPSQLAQKAGVNIAGVSRIIHALAENRQAGAPYKLIKITPSKKNHREKNLYLTPKGKKIMKSILHVMKNL